jgi:uncharacterized protein
MDDICKGAVSHEPLTELAARLVARLASTDGCVVALSGGVDSAVVAKAAQLACGPLALAVTGTSPSLPDGELDAAVRLAGDIGIRHLTIATQELAVAEYVANRGDRCLWCKRELYQALTALARRKGLAHVVNGTNIDDLSDVRPGLRAAEEFGVASPLVDCHINKSDVRRLAQHWQLSVWDKPAGPCLASRLAPGVTVDPQRLARVDQAEQWLRQRGLRGVRVRLHGGELARIEVEPGDVPRLVEENLRTELVARFRQLGFRFVSLDLQGYRTGSFHSLDTTSIGTRAHVSPPQASA